MYTRCTIQWVDDGDMTDALISSEQYSSNKHNMIDDLVFFYGLSPDDLRKACQEQTVMEDEWIVRVVWEVYDDERLLRELRGEQERNRLCEQWFSQWLSRFLK